MNIWRRTGTTVVFVTHSHPGGGVPLDAGRGDVAPDPAGSARSSTIDLPRRPRGRDPRDRSATSSSSPRSGRRSAPARTRRGRSRRRRDASGRGPRVSAGRGRARLAPANIVRGSRMRGRRSGGRRLRRSSSGLGAALRASACSSSCCPRPAVIAAASSTNGRRSPRASCSPAPRPSSACSSASTLGTPAGLGGRALGHRSRAAPAGRDRGERDPDHRLRADRQQLVRAREPAADGHDRRGHGVLPRDDQHGPRPDERRPGGARAPALVRRPERDAAQAPVPNALPYIFTALRIATTLASSGPSSASTSAARATRSGIYITPRPVTAAIRARLGGDRPRLRARHRAVPALSAWSGS